MSKFKDALERGLDSARAVKENNSQIDSVFEELSSEIKSITEGKVYVFLSSLSNSEMYEELGMIIDSDYTAHALYIRNEFERHQIGFVVRTETGYPCTIKFRDTNLHAYDRESLEENINKLMESPFIGRMILYLYEAPF